MIDYIRTEWYGLTYLLHFKGVLFPRLMPVMILAGVLAGLVASEEVEVMDWCEDDSGNRLFEHPYAFQLFGLVFGYMSVARLNISINRYFEGVTVRARGEAQTHTASQRLAGPASPPARLSRVRNPRVRRRNRTSR